MSRLFTFSTLLLLNPLVTHARELYIQRHVPEEMLQNPLPDIAFALIPYHNSHLSAMFYNTSALISALVLLMTADSKIRQIFYKCGSILYLIRLITLFLTILPNADRNCSFGKFPNCTDYVMSGHTIMSLLPLILLMRFDLVPGPVLFLLCVLHVVQEYFKLSGRLHYSVDVFYATVITFLVAQNFGW